MAFLRGSGCALVPSGSDVAPRLSCWPRYLGNHVRRSEALAGKTPGENKNRLLVSRPLLGTEKLELIIQSCEAVKEGKENRVVLSRAVAPLKKSAMIHYNERIAKAGFNSRQVLICSILATCQCSFFCCVLQTVKCTQWTKLVTLALLC